MSLLDAIETQRWKEIERLLDAALELDPTKRGEFLSSSCSGRPELTAEVERLLRSCERAERLFDEPAAIRFAGMLEDPASPAPAGGTRIGPYRLLGEIGEGGMGAVYLAERDDDQYRKRVALKLIRGRIGSLSPDDHLVRRFREERQILASLDHPKIARLLDGNVTAEGLPWFAMEYVEGEAIGRAADSRELTVEQRLRLFLDVCDAVRYAHRNLVVHRDLKPSNILVTEAGEVKLLDFGIAKLLTAGEPGSEAAGQELTRTGLRAMTPEYASPEQVRGEPVSTATDVYSLGVVLYELLTGRRPYRVAGRTAREIEAAIVGQPAERPSAAAASSTREAAARRGATPPRLQRRLRGDLDIIVLTALRKEPERRYASAEQLAADIRRHLDGLPITARADTWPYRAGKFVRRHPVGVA